MSSELRIPLRLLVSIFCGCQEQQGAVSEGYQNEGTTEREWCGVVWCSIVQSALTNLSYHGILIKVD
jgi:hypothetical protein